MAGADCIEAVTFLIEALDDLPAGDADILGQSEACLTLPYCVLCLAQIVVVLARRVAGDPMMGHVKAVQNEGGLQQVHGPAGFAGFHRWIVVFRPLNTRIVLPLHPR